MIKVDYYETWENQSLNLFHVGRAYMAQLPLWTDTCAHTHTHTPSLKTIWSLVNIPIKLYTTPPMYALYKHQCMNASVYLCTLNFQVF